MNARPTTSLVKIAAHQADAAGRAILTAVKAAREKAREERIVYLMHEAWYWRATWRFPFFRRLISAEAEAIVEWGPDTIWSSQWDNRRWSWQMSDEEALAERLIASARIALGGEMFLNLSDAALVAHYTGTPASRNHLTP